MSNDLLNEFHEILASRYPRDGSSMSTSCWVEENTSLNGRRFSFKGYEFQRAITDDMSQSLAVIKPSQVGLALDLDTPVPTTTGWTTMREVKIDDQLFDENGEPCSVTYVSPVYEDRDCYEVEFDTGEIIVADGNHRWYVECSKAFNATGLCEKTGRIPRSSNYSRSGVISTELLSKIYKDENRNLFSIPNSKPLKDWTSPVFIDPYTLGYWLGDGNSYSPNLTSHVGDTPELVERLEMAGYDVRQKPDLENTLSVKFEVPHRAKCNTMHYRLNQYGILKNKHIPQIYLRGSPKQRLELLQGLMDSDGSITKRGRASFHNCNPKLVEGVEELLASLGFKYRTRWRQPTVSSSGIQSKQMIAEVSFVAYKDTPVFRLKRKFERQPESGRRTETSRRHIVRVEKTASRPVRCLTVDSQNHLFLCGKGMIPTHNTEIQVRKFLAFLARNRGVSGIFSLPNEKMFKRLSKTRIKPLLTSDKAFRSFNEGESPSQAMDLIQINSSFGYITGMTEGDATSIPADYLCHDEVDLSDQSLIGLYQSRLQNSSWRMTHKFSTPTLPNFAIDAAYTASDQKEYMCRCDHCNHWQIPVFEMKFLKIPGFREGTMDLMDLNEDDEARFDLDNIEVVCEKCSRPLDILNPDNREWVARFPGRRVSGYRVGPLMTKSLLPAYIIRQQIEMRRLDNVKGWYNTVLGRTFSDGSAQLTDEQLDAVLGDPKDPDLEGLELVVGIDVGMMCHIVIGVLRGELVIPIKFETIPAGDIEEWVSVFCSTYKVVAGCIDRFPYTPTSEAVFQKSKLKIIPTEYRGSLLAQVKLDEFKSISHAQVNRTMVIDRVANLIRRKAISLNGFGSHKEVVYQHLKDMVRVENTEKPPTWEKITGNDHFFHAMALLQVAPRIFELISLSQQVTEDVRTETGFFGLQVRSEGRYQGLFKTRSADGGMFNNGIA